MRKILLLLALPFLLTGCDGVKKADNAFPIRQEKHNPVGDYVYVEDGLFVKEVHTNLHCHKISNVYNPDRVKVREYNHTYIDSHGNKCSHEYCRYCVSDEEYEYLISLDTIR